MNKKSSPALQFKQSHVYGWDEEPVDERPSEFMSTGFALSGYQSANSTFAARRAPPPKRSGWLVVLGVAGTLMALGGWALVHFVPMLTRH